MKKRIISLVLSLVLLWLALPMEQIATNAATTMIESTFNSKLNTFKSDVYKNGSIYKDNSSSTLGYQCFGYANYLAKYIYGSFPTSRNAGQTVNTGWELVRGSSAIDKLHIGDIVRYRYGNSYYTNHSIFITGIDGDTIYYTDANSDGKNTVKWGNKTTRAELKTNVAKYLNDQNGSLLSQKGFVAHYTSWNDTPVLSIKYHANGGSIPVSGYSYEVSDDAGLYLRAGAGTGYEKLGALPKGTAFTVNAGDTKTANGYTWGKTTVKVSGTEKTGWLVISDFVKKTGNVYPKGYYLNSSMVYKSSTSAVHIQKLTYGETISSGLYDYDTFGLVREGYTFAGWSLATEGSEVIDQKRSLRPEEIVPDLKNGSKTVTLYAIWNANEVLVCGDVNGDGVVDTLDRTVLTRYLAGWDGYEIDAEAADVNQDGSVDTRDRAILTRYLADWEGYKVLPYAG